MNDDPYDREFIVIPFLGPCVLIAFAVLLRYLW